MDNTKILIQKWLTKIPVRLVKGTLWLLEVIPLTTILFLPAGVLMTLMGIEVKTSPSTLLMSVTVILLIDGYAGHRRAEEKEQQVMRDFYSWHFKEMKEKDKCDEI